MERGYLYEVSTFFDGPSHVWPLFKVLAEKLMPHSSISFKSGLYNMDSKLYFFVKKKKWYCVLKNKVVFSN